MKKILFHIESLNPGGAEKSLTSLLNNIDLGRYDITILVLKQGGAFEKFIPNNITIKNLVYRPSLLSRLRYKIKRLLFFKNRIHNAQLLWQSINKEIPKYGTNYDIAIAWGQGFATYFVSQKVNAKQKFAWVNTDYEKAGYRPSIDESIYQQYDKIIAVSPYVKNSMQRVFPNLNVGYIRNIIDENEITELAESTKPTDFDKETINIVSVGRLAKPKAFKLAISAIHTLHQMDYKTHLYIIGEGPLRTEIEKEISNLELQNSCSLLGYLENPYPYIKGCDIYLQTSSFEGLGRTLIEAGILKKPIVTTNFPTASMILSHKKTGIIVEMDSKSIALGISSIIDDSQLSEKLMSNLDNFNEKETSTSINSIHQLLG